MFHTQVGGAMVILKGACLGLTIEVKGDYGLQRLFGLLGVMIFSPVSGALIDYYSQGLPVSDFRPAFYLFGLFIGIAVVVMLGVDLDFKPPAKNLFKDLKFLAKNLELMMFFFANFMSGAFYGFLSGYLFWFLEDLGGTRSLMGLTSTVSGLSGIPILLLADTIFRKIGHANVQIIGFLVYITRLVGYSLIYEPYMCLLFEVMEAVTSSLMQTSAIAYAAELGTTQTLATIQGIVQATYFGMGRGVGGYVGGLLIKVYGTRVTYRILGGASLVSAILYFLFNVLYINPKHRREEKQKTAVPPQQIPAEDNGHVNTAFSQEKIN